MILKLSRQIAQSQYFNSFILAVILAAGVVVGIQTYVKPGQPLHQTLERVDFIVLLIFTTEIVIKMLAVWPKPQYYFLDPWNIFDFAIVAVCWLAHLAPAVDTGFIAVIRLARVLRVMRLVQTLPELKMLINAMLKSIPSMGYVGVMLLLLYYIYGAMGVFLFRDNDPVYFGNLHTAMLSLFQISTLEGWADIMFVNMFGCDDPTWGYDNPETCLNPHGHGSIAILYFVSFVLIGTMIVLNLFIGVIMNSMDEVRKEHALEMRHMRQKEGLSKLEDEVEILNDQLEGIKKQLDYIVFRMKKD